MKTRWYGNAAHLHKLLACRYLVGGAGSCGTCVSGRYPGSTSRNAHSMRSIDSRIISVSCFPPCVAVP